MTRSSDRMLEEETEPAAIRGVPLACPKCHGSLNSNGAVLRCRTCANEYELLDGRPFFITPPKPWLPPRPETGSWFRRGLSRPPHPARFAGEISSSETTNDHRLLREFLATIPRGAKVLDLGSGERRMTAGVVNLDVVASPSVDVVADGHELPFPDETFGAIVLQSVIEHVPEPATMLAECVRVMAPGGQIWVEAPFMYPVHDQSDYYRWTLSGLRYFVSKNFEVLRGGVLMGPSSALNLNWRSYLNWKLRTLHWGIRNSLAWMTAWLRFLDGDEALAAPPETYALSYVLGVKTTKPQ
jgi:SAM-dependent methyltransferase